jgi:hypothetical protein
MEIVSLLLDRGADIEATEQVEIYLSFCGYVQGIFFSPS